MRVSEFRTEGDRSMVFQWLPGRLAVCSIDTDFDEGWRDIPLMKVGGGSFHKSVAKIIHKSAAKIMGVFGSLSHFATFQLIQV